MLNAISLSPTSFRTPIELQEGLQLDLAHGLGIPGPYDKRSADLQFYTNGLKTYRVPDQLTTKEAAGIFQAWMNEEALHTRKFPPHCKFLRPPERSDVSSAKGYVCSQGPLTVCSTPSSRRQEEMPGSSCGRALWVLWILSEVLVVINTRAGCPIYIGSVPLQVFWDGAECSTEWLNFQAFG
jgi:hypothetical protein